MKIYCIHPAVSSIETLRSFLGVEVPGDAQWDSSAPDVLIASEWIYYKRKYFREFERLYNRSGVRVAYLGEALEPDFNVFDYAVGFSNRHGGDERFIRLAPPLEMYWRFFPSVMPGSPSVMPGSSSVMPGSPAVMPGSPSVIPGSPSVMPGSTGHLAEGIPAQGGYDNAVMPDLIGHPAAFCNFLYSNAEAHPMRDALFYRISEYKRVDSLGRHLNNTGRGGTGYGGGHAAESVLLRQGYKFSIAAENAEFPGYTSEKIFCALAARTVPIYWGNPDICEDVNPAAFISVRDYPDNKALIERIKHIDCDDSLWLEMVLQPWRTPQQEAAHNARSAAYREFFERLFEGRLERTAPEGFHAGRYRQWFLQGRYSFDKTLIWNKNRH